MAKQVINIGAAPNDGTGTPLRTSFDYTNQNFTELYNGSGIGTSTNTQVLFNDSGVANGDAGLVYNKTTDELSVGGNVVMSTSGKGIDFTATASGSGTMTSELLNDYEEGTWVITDASGAGLVFASSAYLKYTKIGRAVTVQGSVTYPSTASSVSAILGGFPFTAADIIFLSVAYTDASIASFTYFTSTNGTEVILTTPGLNVLNSTLSGKTIQFFGTYMT